ncbi:glutaredoxin-C9-like [Vicia villosa]|uniref:glutaredoxin-C9-like n=1 Tax=Vicia villosa TaxID=3911 RepID=UPI00273B3AC8|nr:glutaredoxin-C9-like [Vicia villosa]
MYQAIPYRPSVSTVTRDLPISGGIHDTNIITMVSENAVIIIGTRGCCLCHVVKRLLQGLGVNPPVYEVDQDRETSVVAQLSTHASAAETVQFPAVFVGGKLLGGLERVMASHISGELVPILKDAGALWL